LRRKNKTQLAQAVSRYLADRSPRVRVAALDLVREKDLREVNASVLGLLTDKSGIVRHAAVECLGVLHEGEAVEASWLYPLLKDPVLIVRVETVESLAQIGDRTALPLIAERLQDHDALVRAYAARSIAALDGMEYITAIESASKMEADENAKVGFADALFALGDASQFSVLLEFLSSADYHVRCASANALSVADFTPVPLQSALEAVSYAAHHALAVADRSTMERVEKELRGQL
jgi:HEAT repeat protein